MSHFIEQERKVIPNLLSNHKTAKEIGQVLGKIQFLHVAPKKKIFVSIYNFQSKNFL